MGIFSYGDVTTSVLSHEEAKNKMEQKIKISLNFIVVKIPRLAVVLLIQSP